MGILQIPFVFTFLDRRLNIKREILNYAEAILNVPLCSYCLAREHHCISHFSIPPLTSFPNSLYYNLVFFTRYTGKAENTQSNDTSFLLLVLFTPWPVNGLMLGLLIRVCCFTSNWEMRQKTMGIFLCFLWSKEERQNVHCNYSNAWSETEIPVGYCRGCKGDLFCSFSFLAIMNL